MRGITLLFGGNIVYDNKHKYEEVRFDNGVIYKNYNKKFESDKIFVKNHDLFMAVDGVIINNHELNKKYGTTNNKSLIDTMYKAHSMSFINELRGNYYGLIFDEKKKELNLFTNHLGNKPVYYYYDKDRNILIASSDLFELSTLMKNNGLQVKLCEEAAYFMLTFGYMLFDYTLIQGVKKLNPGTILTYNNEDISFKEYYFVNNENIVNHSEEKVMQELYERFNLALKQSFDKDEEFGYEHLAYLSGGLDSRMIAIGAKKLGYSKITTLTFSENNSLDEKIARDVAKDFKLNSIFNSLNNGEFAKDISKCVDKNFGQILYSGASHLGFSNDMVNLDKFGMLHNGNMADIMHGDYIDDIKHNKPCLSNWAYSRLLIDRVGDFQTRAEEIYGNEERFAIYNRGINGIFNGSISSLDTAETSEDYTHFDIIDYSTKIPCEFKYKETAFLKMIQKYYPEATNYKWQKWNARPTAFNTKLMNSNLGKMIMRIDGGLDRYVFSQSKNMNPFDKWYKENISLRQYIDSYISENMNLLDSYSTLKNDCIRMVNEGRFTEKAQVITLLEFMKRID